MASQREAALISVPAPVCHVSGRQVFGVVGAQKIGTKVSKKLMPRGPKTGPFLVPRIGGHMQELKANQAWRSRKVGPLLVPRFGPRRSHFFRARALTSGVTFASQLWVVPFSLWECARKHSVRRCAFRAQTDLWGFHLPQPIPP